MSGSAFKLLAQRAQTSSVKKDTVIMGQGDMPRERHNKYVWPQFVDGDYSNDAFDNYLQSKLIYPEEACKKNIQGSVYIEYYVDTAGVIKDVIIRRGVPELNQAALNAFIGVCKYTKPGYGNGAPVSLRILIVVKFGMECTVDTIKISF